MKRPSLLALALLATASCEGTEKIGGPSGPTESVSLDFCAFLRPTWMAVRNEGAPWTQITVPATGPVTFDATEKVSIAMTISFFFDFTQIVNVSRDEVAGQSLFDCDELAPGDRELTGTVTGIAENDIAVIGASAEQTSAGSFNPEWELTHLPTGAMDLIAMRMPGPTNEVGDRIIVRRNQTSQAAGTSAPIALNFAATEAQPPQSATLTLNNIGTDFVDVTSNVLTANGTLFTLSLTSGTGNLGEYQSLPAAVRIDSDFHTLEASASTDIGSRDVFHFYKAPAAKTFTFGPLVSMPTVSTVATTPVKLMRAQLPSQIDYSTAAGVAFSQSNACGEGCFDFRLVVLITSAAFLGGTPATWDLTIPDLSAAGYPAERGLQNSATPVEWQVFALGGTAGITAAPVDGATITSSVRSSEPMSVQGLSKASGCAHLRCLPPQARGAAWPKASTKSSSWLARALSPGRRPPRPR